MPFSNGVLLNIAVIFTIRFGPGRIRMSSQAEWRYVNVGSLDTANKRVKIGSKAMVLGSDLCFSDGVTPSGSRDRIEPGHSKSTAIFLCLGEKVLRKVASIRQDASPCRHVV
jgi:urease beta subunit